MGKVQLKIEFDQSDAVYREGETVRGRVVVSCSEETKVKVLMVDFQGVGLLNWKGNLRNVTADLSKPIQFAEKEQYLKHSITLIKKGSGGYNKDPVLPGGEQTFAFALQLPTGLPSSFSGNLGAVFYWAKATLERPWKSDNEIKKVFNVVNLVDLNTIPHVTVPVEKNLHKTISGMCWSSGNISATWRLNHTGYTPTDSIQINGAIQNESSKKIIASKAELIQDVVYHGKHRTSHESGVVATLSRGEISPGHCEVWQDGLVVPLVAATGITGCSFLSVKYQLKLSVITGTPANDLCHVFDIVIGTIPLRGFGTTESPTTPTPPLPPRDPPTVPITPLQITFDTVTPTAPSLDTIQKPWSDAPPTYDESMLTP